MLILADWIAREAIPALFYGFPPNPDKNGSFLFFALLLTGAAFAQPYDLVIRNGRVIDGSGKAQQRADVAITGGRIVKIGAIKATDARRVIEANGQIVAPGFIDAHVERDPVIISAIECLFPRVSRPSKPEVCSSS